MISFRASSEGHVVCQGFGVHRLLNVDEARALEPQLQQQLIAFEGTASESELRSCAMSLARAIMDAKAMQAFLGAPRTLN